MKDVARTAGVAVGTVSNVLNKPDTVAETTRHRVEAAIIELGYIRNEAARQLRTSHDDNSAPAVPMLPDTAQLLGLTLVAGTEATAARCFQLMGLGEPGSMPAAADALRTVIERSALAATAVIGDRDSSGIRVGERFGNGDCWDLAVKMVDGPALTARALPDAVSMVGVAQRAAMITPPPELLMKKLVVPAAAAGRVDPDAPLSLTLTEVARATGRQVSDLTVAVLDRTRHLELVSQIRHAGARVRYLSDGDVTGAIMVADPSSGVDLLAGVGGAAEGVLAACALRCLGGQIIGRFAAETPADAQNARKAGLDLDAVYTTTDLVGGGDVFFAATGITDGTLLRGVRSEGHHLTTHSLAASSAGTLRRIEGRHELKVPLPPTPPRRRPRRS